MPAMGLLVLLLLVADDAIVVFGTDGEHTSATTVEPHHFLVVGGGAAFDCSVTDAAMAVGYRSVSPFARAFSDQYGISPSRCGVRAE
jgi:AraC-like DNA-binding protein